MRTSCAKWPDSPGGRGSGGSPPGSPRSGKMGAPRSVAAPIHWREARTHRNDAHPLSCGVRDPPHQWLTNKQIGAHVNAVLKPVATSDCAIADAAPADWGRKEIRIAETEMPGLMAIRQEFART